MIDIMRLLIKRFRKRIFVVKAIWQEKLYMLSVALKRQQNILKEYRKLWI